MYHYVYKVKSNSGKYYFGRHSTKNLEDGYLGSGKWVRSLKDKSDLVKEILEFCDNFDDLLKLEHKYISENIGKDDCMNFNSNPIGFASGDLNPAKSIEERLKRSVRCKENNPSRLPGVGDKISSSLKGRPCAHKGKPMSEQGKKNCSEGAKERKISEEGRKKLSEARKRQFKDKTFYDWTGETHSEETLDKMKNTALSRQRYECQHCKQMMTKQNLTRWHNDKCKSIACEENGY